MDKIPSKLLNMHVENYAIYFSINLLFSSDFWLRWCK